MSVSYLNTFIWRPQNRDHLQYIAHEYPSYLTRVQLRQAMQQLGTPGAVPRKWQRPDYMLPYYGNGMPDLSPARSLWLMTVRTDAVAQIAREQLTRPVVRFLRLRKLRWLAIRISTFSDLISAGHWRSRSDRSTLS